MEDDKDDKPRKADGSQLQANIRSKFAAERLQDPTYTGSFFVHFTR